MVGAFALMGAKMFRPQTKVKSSKNKAVDTLASVNEDTINRLQVELKKQNGRANRLQALRNNEVIEEEEDNQPEKKEVTFEEITALVNNSYPQYAKYLPLAKKQIMEATSGMTMEEILTYVKQFTGNQKPTGETNQISQQYNPDWA